MRRPKHIYLRFDLGASSGRAVLGTIENQRLKIDEIAQFPNTPCRLGDHLHWNVLSLWDHFVDAIRLCAQRGHSTLSGIGVDTWGVDFGLLGRDDLLLPNPLCYRDAITEGIKPVIRAAIAEEELYRRTDWPVVRVSMLSYLVAMNRNSGAVALQSAQTLLMMSDLFRHFLCGHKAVELTAGGSGQLIDIRSGAWYNKLLATFRLPKKILSPIVRLAMTVGKLHTHLVTGQLRTVADIRQLVRDSFTLKAYHPRTKKLWDKHGDRYREIVRKSHTR